MVRPETTDRVGTAPARATDPGARRDALLLAIDVGTQSTRAAIVDLQGGVHHLVRTPVAPYFSTHPGWAEQDPATYWEAVAASCRETLRQAGADVGRIVAVTLSTQRGTFVNVDTDGTPLRPAIVWLDQRKASTEGIIPPLAVPLLKAAGVHRFVDYVTRYCRSNWLRQNEPRTWARTHKFLCLSGWVTHRMTGEFRDSAGNILGTMPIDPRRWRWAGRWDPRWRLFHVEPEKLPELVLPGETLGRVTARAAAETGIPAGLPFIAASNDKACEILGAGCLTPETACVSLGTFATLNAHGPRYVELQRLLPPWPSAVPRQFYTEVGVQRGMWMVSWFKEEFGLEERQRAEREGKGVEELFDELLERVPPGAMGLVLQPYWTPGTEVASYAKGSIIGFGDVHGRAHLYRAIVEGIAHALRDGARRTERGTGVAIERARACGGGSQSDAILQVLADVLAVPVERLHTHETSVVGAAIDAAVGLGLHPDFPSAVAAMTRPARTFAPDPARAALYRDLHERVYLRLYDRLDPLYREIQQITGYPE